MWTRIGCKAVVLVLLSLSTLMPDAALASNDRDTWTLVGKLDRFVILGEKKVRIRDAAFRPDGTVVTAMGECGIYVWDEDGDFVDEIAPNFCGWRFSGNGKRLAGFDSTNCPTVFDLDRGEIVYPRPKSAQPTGSPFVPTCASDLRLAISEDGERLAVLETPMRAPGSVAVVGVALGTRMAEVDFSSLGVRSPLGELWRSKDVDFAMRGEMLVVQGDNSCIMAISLREGRTTDTKCIGARISSISASGPGKVIVQTTKGSLLHSLSLVKVAGRHIFREPNWTIEHGLLSTEWTFVGEHPTKGVVLLPDPEGKIRVFSVLYGTEDQPLVSDDLKGVRKVVVDLKQRRMLAFSPNGERSPATLWAFGAD